MITTNSLADKNLITDTFLLKYSVVSADLDHTLIDFDKAHVAGIKGMSLVHGHELATKVDDIFKTLLSVHQNKKGANKVRYDKILSRISELENQSIPKYGMKMWCREAWIIIAAEELGIKLTCNDVISLRDAYWQTLSEHSFLYEDANYFIKKLKEKNILLILMTGSDADMEINDDLSVILLKAIFKCPMTKVILRF